MRAALGDSTFAEVPLAALESAIESAGAGGGGETRALVAERGNGTVGLVLYGIVAGAAGAGRLQLVVVAPEARGQGVGRALLGHAEGELAREGARFVLVELPDDPSLDAARALLRSAGYAEESRIPDFHRDGVALLFLRREIA